MIRNILGNIEGIEFLAIAGFFIFFTIYIGVLIKALRLDKNHLEKMSNLPLEEDSHKNKI
ncbi:MAG: hypothetical protein C0425_03445 [Chlorobiaceae bacterium]|nr:hypothetical protein [Chlorobiaceae bacterium]MBA4309370.1 hypothetical protein [Chlorobiaceae bacterium]